MELTQESRPGTGQVGRVEIAATAELAGIPGQTERLQGLAQDLANAVETLEQRCAMVTRKDESPSGALLAYPEPPLISDHALALCQTANLIEGQLHRIQELAGRIDH